jgi:hypothetical protein
MVSGKLECRFKGSLIMEGQTWDWCFYYNGEISRLDCDKCPIIESNVDHSVIREEIFA